MTPHYPDAVQIPFLGKSGGSYVPAAPFRGILHTAESKDYHPSQTSYFGHHNPPHFTLVKKSSKVTIYQHYSINVASRALANKKKSVSDVETNRQAAIQIEICWYASQIATLPQDMKDALSKWMRWVEKEAGIVKKGPKFYGENAYGEGGIGRMSAKNWNAFNGWCGHQHVPENLHWDPGQIDIDSLLA